MSYFTVALLNGTSIATFGPQARELPQAIEGRIDQIEPVRLLFRSWTRIPEAESSSSSSR